jgi:hypothetical protein
VASQAFERMHNTLSHTVGPKLGYPTVAMLWFVSQGNVIMGAITIQPDGSISSSASLAVTSTSDITVTAIANGGTFLSDGDSTMTIVNGEYVSPAWNVRRN